jgi:hypothetical protein
MKLTPAEISERRRFLRTHREQERLYFPRFRAALNRQFRRAAKQYEGQGFFDPSIISTEDLEPIYRRLYTINTIREASREWRANVKPALNQVMRRKDIIDDLAAFLGFGREGSIIQLWRELLQDFLNVRILTRIRQVNETTRNRIAEVIQEGVNAGLAHRDIARQIREAGKVNRVRAMAISRTEVSTAMNQGKYLAVQSSNLVYDKGWSAHTDSRTRPDHLAMLDSDMIPLNADFIVGGEPMAYPGDPRGSAANVINCRCSLVFRVRRDANGLPMRRSETIEAI